jgi:large subunit ribosomal protein L29
MSTIDVKELRQLSSDELAEKAKQLAQELFNLRFQMGTGRLENPMQIRKTKRSIARRRPSGERVAEHGGNWSQAARMGGARH